MALFFVYSENSGPLQCRFCPEVEKLFITNGYVSGLRKDLNGVLLLDSILQPPLKGPCLDPVVLELTLSDVSVKLRLPIIRSYFPVGESEMLTTTTVALLIIAMAATVVVAVTMKTKLHINHFFWL